MGVQVVTLVHIKLGKASILFTLARMIIAFIFQILGQFLFKYDVESLISGMNCMTRPDSQIFVWRTLTLSEQVRLLCRQFSPRSQDSKAWLCFFLWQVLFCTHVFGKYKTNIQQTDMVCIVEMQKRCCKRRHKSSATNCGLIKVAVLKIYTVVG